MELVSRVVELVSEVLGLGFKVLGLGPGGLGFEGFGRSGFDFCVLLGSAKA